MLKHVLQNNVDNILMKLRVKQRVKIRAFGFKKLRVKQRV